MSMRTFVNMAHSSQTPVFFVWSFRDLAFQESHTRFLHGCQCSLNKTTPEKSFPSVRLFFVFRINCGLSDFNKDMFLQLLQCCLGLAQPSEANSCCLIVERGVWSKVLFKAARLDAPSVFIGWVAVLRYFAAFEKGAK